MPPHTGTGPTQSHTPQIVPCLRIPVLTLPSNTLLRLYHASAYRYWPYPITPVRLYHASAYRYWAYPITHSSDCTTPPHTGTGPTQSHTPQIVPCLRIPVLALPNHTLVRLYHASAYRYWPYPITHSSDCTTPPHTGTGPTQSHTPQIVPCLRIPVLALPNHTLVRLYHASAYRYWPYPITLVRLYHASAYRYWPYPITLVRLYHAFAYWYWPYPITHSSDCTMPLHTGTGPTQSHTRQIVPCHCIPVLALPNHTLVRLYHATAYRYWPYPITHSSDCTMPLHTGTGPTQSHTRQIVPATAYRYWPYPITHSSDCTMPLHTGTGPTQSHTRQIVPRLRIPVLALPNHTLVRLYHASAYRYWPYPITHSSDCTMPPHTGTGPTQSHTRQIVPRLRIPVLALPNHTLVRLYHASAYRYWPYPITHSSDCTTPPHTGTGPTQSHTRQIVPCLRIPVLALPNHTLVRLYHASAYRYWPYPITLVRLYHATAYQYWPYPITHSSDCTMPLHTGTGPTQSHLSDCTMPLHTSTGPTQSHTRQIVPRLRIPVLALPNHTCQIVPCHCIPVLALPNHTLVRLYHATAYRYWPYPITLVRLYHATAYQYWPYPITHSSDCTMPLHTGTGPTQSHLSDCTMPLHTSTGPTQSHTRQIVPRLRIPVLALPNHTRQIVPCHCIPVLALPNHTCQIVPCHCIPVLAPPNHTLVRLYHAFAYRYWPYPITLVRLYHATAYQYWPHPITLVRLYHATAYQYSRYWP